MWSSIFLPLQYSSHKEIPILKSTETPIHMFITSILDYCNSLFYSLLNSLTLKLQRIQQACAHLVYSVTKFCLRDLHWLPVRQLIDFKIILITFKILNNMAPSYLSSLICVATPSGSQFL